MKDDPSATYRGFRRQALYSLWRILSDTDGALIFQPEGAEDLAVFDSDLRLVEAIQVKDFTGKLSLSDLKPQSDAGFFARMLERRREHPNARTVLASYGDLGPELLEAIEGSSLSRGRVLDKLLDKQSSLSRSEATELLDGLQGNVECPDASELEAKVLNDLQSTVAQADVETALDLLLIWLLKAAESRRSITRASLFGQIESIGEFLTTVRTQASEWMSTVSPVNFTELSDKEAESLRSEYRRGVHATWKHILADADCSRLKRLQEIHEQFERCQVVLVRGASGQGKSTLCWRYLREYSADGLRFHVRLIDGREHAARVAHLLQRHIRKLGLSAIVYLDVSPQDEGWFELIRGLSDSGAKILVAAREEDVRRAGEAHRELQVAEVLLDQVDREEAVEIFQALQLEGSTDFPDFEDAWAQFASTGRGALLEFSYLIAEGESLADRLEVQVRRIQEDARSSRHPGKALDLRILAICAAAHAADARVSNARLLEHLALDPLQAPLQLLEKEFLIKVETSFGKVVIAPVHPIRGAIIRDVLSQDAGEAWLGIVKDTVAVTYDDDIDRYQRRVFLDRRDMTDDLLGFLMSFQPPSWRFAGGVLNALLWECLNRYEREHKNTLSEAINTHGPPIDTAFGPVAQWLKEAKPPSSSPKEDNDWAGIGDLLFWSAHTNRRGPLAQEGLSLLESAPVVELSLEPLSKLTSGAHIAYPQQFEKWLPTRRGSISRRFLNETLSVHLEDDGTVVRVVYPIPSLSDESFELNRESMRRIELLHQLFPDREVYGAQALGMEMLGSILPHDESRKNIPRENLPAPRLVHQNATLLALIAYRHQRPKDWSSYRQKVIDQRRRMADGLKRISTFVEELMALGRWNPKMAKKYPAQEIQDALTLDEPPHFPQAAVDPFGFISEGREKMQVGAPEPKTLALLRYKNWKREFEKYSSGVQTALQNAGHASLDYIARRWKACERSEETKKSAHLAIINLDTAWEHQRRMQSECRRIFHDSKAIEDLDELDKLEGVQCEDLWHLIFHLTDERAQRNKNGLRWIRGQAKKQETDFQEAILTGTAIELQGDAERRLLQCNLGEKSCLVLIVNRHSLPPPETTRELLTAIWSEVHRVERTHLSWTPLVRKWDSLVVVTLLRGRLLAPTVVRIPLILLFGEQFDVSDGTLMETPISSEDLPSMGIELWNAPLIRTTSTWSIAVLGFILASAKWRLIDAYADEEIGESEELPEAILRLADSELENTFSALFAAHRDLEALLRAMHPSVSRDTWLADLSWPPTEDPTNARTLPAYVHEFMEAPERMAPFMQELVEYALSVSGPS